MQLVIDKAYFDKKLEEIPRDFLIKAVEHLQSALPREVQEIIKRAIKKDGLYEWLFKNRYHMGLGMEIRNSLREAGLGDESLPDKNWDDYYHQVVEIAVGTREMPQLKSEKSNFRMIRL